MSMMRPASLVNISGNRHTTAYTCALVTGFPSLRRCKRWRLMASAIWSVVIPPLRCTITYTIASSIFINTMANSKRIRCQVLWCNPSFHTCDTKKKWLYLRSAPFCHKASFSSSLHLCQKAFCLLIAMGML